MARMKTHDKQAAHRRASERPALATAGERAVRPGVFPSRTRPGRRGQGSVKRNEAAPTPIDPDAQLPEVLALAKLRADLAAGVEGIDADDLAEATQAADFARLRAEGERTKRREAEEAERRAKVAELIAWLTGDGPAEKAAEILRLRDEAERTLRALHEAASAMRQADERAIGRLRALVGDGSRRTSVTTRELSDRIGAMGVEVPASFSSHVDEDLAARIVGHAVTFALDYGDVSRVTDKAVWFNGSRSRAGGVVDSLRRRASREDDE